MRWVPREQISDVDSLSRLIDYDDWETTPYFFHVLQEKWGKFSLDCFADSDNAKTLKFYSKFLCPRTSGVDAFFVFMAR